LTLLRGSQTTVTCVMWSGLLLVVGCCLGLGWMRVGVVFGGVAGDGVAVVG
jgi:hypothetical protein